MKWELRRDGYSKIRHAWVEGWDKILERRNRKEAGKERSQREGEEWNEETRGEQRKGDGDLRKPWREDKTEDMKSNRCKMMMSWSMSFFTLLLTNNILLLQTSTTFYKNTKWSQGSKIIMIVMLVIRARGPVREISGTPELIHCEV